MGCESICEWQVFWGELTDSHDKSGICLPSISDLSFEVVGSHNRLAQLSPSYNSCLALLVRADSPDSTASETVTATVFWQQISSGVWTFLFVFSYQGSAVRWRMLCSPVICNPLSFINHACDKITQWGFSLPACAGMFPHLCTCTCFRFSLLWYFCGSSACFPRAWVSPL